MTITAKVIADSISLEGIRLTTMQLRYPKFIHGEFLTHRSLSRNSSSSRAIPVERIIQDVLDDPAMPVYWGKNQKGMQAQTELDSLVAIPAPSITGEWRSFLKSPEEAWLEGRDRACEIAIAMAKAGYHKQIVNRIIEPWCHINTVVTSTDWANFYALRCHPDAQPEMRTLAEAMRDARNASIPEELAIGEWHLPYVDPRKEVDSLPTRPDGCDLSWHDWFEQCLIRISVARCARVSYSNHDGTAPDIQKDLELYDRLVGSSPLHASPAEHQATPDEITVEYMGWANEREHGNFDGWRQYRKMLPNECVEDQ